MNKRFGQVVKEYRGNKSLQKLAGEIKISSAYLCDIEKGNRYPSREVLDKFVKIFNLQGKERNSFYDLVAKERPDQYKVSADIVEYIMKNEVLRNFIRMAKDENLGNEYWERKTKELEMEVK